MCVVVDVTPSAVHVGNIVQGVRMAWAQGRDIGAVDDESDAAKKVRTNVSLQQKQEQCSSVFLTARVYVPNKSYYSASVISHSLSAYTKWPAAYSTDENKT